MAFSLTLVKDDGSTKEIPLTRSRIVGRDEDCDLRIPAATVSREHCEIAVEPDGLRIKDLASSNGTFVNGEQVDEAQLQAGDIISIGPANFVVRVDGKPAVDHDAVMAAAERAQAASPPSERRGGGGATATAGTSAAGQGGLLEDDEDIAKALDAEASGIEDFDFSLDDEDDQPPL